MGAVGVMDKWNCSTKFHFETNAWTPRNLPSLMSWSHFTDAGVYTTEVVVPRYEMKSPLGHEPEVVTRGSRYSVTQTCGFPQSSGIRKGGA